MPEDDPELQLNDDPSHDKTHSSKQRRIEADSNKLISVMIVVLLALIVAGGLYYFVTRQPPERDTTLQSKFASLEEKIAGLEKQIADLQGNPAAVSSDPSLLHQVQTLSRRVETLENRTNPTTESKIKPPPSKPSVAAPERFHTVQKGETLSKISKKYGIPVEKLRTLNGLSQNQPVRTGQKLLISAGK